MNEAHTHVATCLRVTNVISLAHFICVASLLRDDSDLSACFCSGAIGVASVIGMERDISTRLVWDETDGQREEVREDSQRTAAENRFQSRKISAQQHCTTHTRYCAVTLSFVRRCCLVCVSLCNLLEGVSSVGEMGAAVASLMA